MSAVHKRNASNVSQHIYLGSYRQEQEELQGLSAADTTEITKITAE
jgi:hypothetical protein